MSYNLNEELWFSYPIWYFLNVYENNEELLNYCLLRKGYDDGVTKSNIGGWQSSNLYVDSDNVITKFSKFLENYVDLLRQRFDIRLQIQNIWININGFRTQNMLHVHPKSMFSGIYYVKANPDLGNVVFESPMKNIEDFIFAGVGQYPKIYANTVSYKPETGKLILFPSFIPHYVDANPTNIDRISIAFNIAHLHD